MSLPYWIPAILASLLIHALLAAFYFSGEEAIKTGSINKGQTGLEIGLGRLGSHTNSIKKNKTSHPEKIKKVKNTKPVVKLKNKDFKKAKTHKIKTVHKNSSNDKLPPVSKQKPPASTASTEKRKDTEKLEKTNTDKQSEAAIKGGGQASDSSQGGYLTAGHADYFSQLITWLNRHKNYPKRAKRNKQQGIVELRFTINRNGDVLEKSIKTSSGYSVLDRAALKILEAAAPLPALPEGMKKNQLTLIVPIDYSLIVKAHLGRE